MARTILIAVRVEEADSLESGYSYDPKMLYDLTHRDLGDEAQVGRTGCRLFCFGLKLLAGLVQVDLLLSERQSPAALAKGHYLHP